MACEKRTVFVAGFPGTWDRSEVKRHLFAQLRRSVASHAGHTLGKHLYIIAWAVCLSAVLREYVDEAVSTPLDHGQASSV